MTDWRRRDLAVNWHPYTQMRECGEVPLPVITRARGVKLYDEQGNWYYDTIGSWWSSVHGHCHPAIMSAIRRQTRTLDHVLFAGFTHAPAIELAEELVRIAPPGLARVFYSDDGSTAVEVALKLSLQYWRNTGRSGKNKFVALDRAYHGDTAGAMSVGALGPFTRPYRALCVPQLRVPTPECRHCPMGHPHPDPLPSRERGKTSCGIGCLRPLARLLQRDHRRIAGLILEPLLCAAGGMIVYPKEYLAGAARLARRYGVHLILDEVATGFGRTGQMFACDHLPGLCPDFLCVGKGMTGGTVTLAATLTTEKIYRAFFGPYATGKTFFHGHTFTANPIACAAALANLKLFRTERTLARARPVMTRLRRRLETFRALPLVGDVRSLGMVGVLELVVGKGTARERPAPRELMLAIYRAGLARHLVLRPLGNLLYLWPPLTVSGRELDWILDGITAILRGVNDPRGSMKSKPF